METVRIVRFDAFGDADVLRISHEALPEPGPGEVRLRVKAIGINRAEVMVREANIYGIQYFPPSSVSRRPGSSKRSVQASMRNGWA